MERENYLDELEKKYTPVVSRPETVSDVTALLSTDRLEDIDENTRNSKESIKRQYLYTATGIAPAPEETIPTEEPEIEISQTRKVIRLNLFEILSIIMSALIVIAGVFTFLFRPVGVSGHSMNPTLDDGDWLLVRTIYNNPQYGDIVIVTQPNEFDEPLVKRVIATGGQKVYIDYEQGYVFVDDEPLAEYYTSSLTTQPLADEMDYPVYVPYGYVFVMGDNRNNSTDSRSQSVGFIKEEYILGKAVARFIPFGSFSIY